MGVLLSLSCAGILSACLTLNTDPLPTYAPLVPTVTSLPGIQNSFPPAAPASAPTPVDTPVPFPPTGDAPTGADCTPQTAPRARVISYTVRAGEDLACLAAKFRLLPQTIREANAGILANNNTPSAPTILRIPPGDGTLYILQDEDIESKVTVEMLADWYGIPDSEIVEWTGMPASEPLHPGQKLFFPSASPLQKPFNIRLLDLNPLTSSLPTASDLWQTPGQYDTGYCPLVDGVGRPGPPMRPIHIQEAKLRRTFRPGQTGIDIPAPTGTDVHAAQTGTVVWAGFSTTGTGNLIILAHGDGWQTLYAHLTQVLTHCGQQIEQGAIIGHTGQSLFNDEPQLYFEIRRGQFSFDPMLWLR